MIKILSLLAGGALGTLARYSVSGLAHGYWGTGFPIGTLMVNLLGSLIIGFLWGIFENTAMSPQLRSFVFVGFLGGFTTFSSYSLETMNLFREGQIRLGLINILVNNVLGLVLVFAGFIIARTIRN